MVPEEVPGALAQLDQARADGFWVAGYASYELGYALEPKLAHLMPEARRLPLLQFGLYRAPCQGGALHLPPRSGCPHRALPGARPSIRRPLRWCMSSSGGRATSIRPT